MKQISVLWTQHNIHVLEAIDNDRRVLSHVGNRPERIVANPLGSILIGPALCLHQPFDHSLIVIDGTTIIRYTDQSIVVTVVREELYSA